MEGSIEEGEVEWEGESPLKRRKSAGSSHDHGMENKPGKRGAQV